VHQRPPPCLQYAKPKSWDNLTTKSFGGYGFGYGYLDTATVKTHSAERPSKGLHGGSGSGRSKTPIVGTVQRKTSSCGTSSSSTAYSTATASSTASRHFQPTKSTESLLIPPGPYQGDLDQASLSCECLDGGSSGGSAGGGTRFVQLDKHKRTDETASYMPSSHAQVRHRRSSHSDGKLRAINNSEVTRL